jgi:hypothetical protein
MRYIGRIITTGKIDGVSEFIDVTKDTSSVVDNDTKIPTLIIGYKKAQEICGSLKTRDRQIGKNLYWTFSKRERRVDYEPDLEKFFKTVSGFLMKFCNYEYVDMITCGKEKKEELLSIISDNKKKVIYSTDSMYYIYYPKSNKVYGVSIDILKFLGIDDSFSESISTDCTMEVSDSDFLDSKISNSKFIQPVLYYLRRF